MENDVLFGALTFTCIAVAVNAWVEKTLGPWRPEHLPITHLVVNTMVIVFVNMVEADLAGDS